MRIAVSGSIATDHLMAFPGRFTDQLIPDQLAHISLSFLVDDLEVRRGGVAANIAYGLGQLGLTPLLVGSVGLDFGPYEIWLKEQGVDTGAVRVSDTAQTARFVCITDQDSNQIAAFYAGAMSEAREIDLAAAAAQDRPDLVLVCANDPAAMLRHTRQATGLGIPFAADPSQQLARLTGEEASELVDGATWLFTNEYEAALLAERTGRTREDILASVGTWVTTLGERGVRIERSGESELLVPAVPCGHVTDPTGAGDGFRAGFLAASAAGLPLLAAGRLGCAVAASVLDTVGPQGYAADPGLLAERVRDAYGAEAAAELRPVLGRDA
ncbi:carbohydrate kinase family protein [Streptomyces sp. NBC_01278]|uniref:carbohydrate kinase family protein n=1 Tax=Streptomyces sp. NBC_01278 TaxID=2903809 RepID=UPI002E357D66|nr:carbohydrate kinase family protein [Streptomyces sp. NBC_01278]